MIPGVLMRPYIAKSESIMKRLLLFGIELDVANKPWDEAVVIGGCLEYREPQTKLKLAGQDWSTKWLRRAGIESAHRKVRFNEATGIIETTFTEEHDGKRLAGINSFAVPLDSVRSTATLSELVHATIALYRDHPDLAGEHLGDRAVSPVG